MIRPFESRIAALVLAAVLLGGCKDLSDYGSVKLRPLNVVTYVTTNQQVIRKQAHFSDGQSNVFTLTDDAQDGLLPYGDRDGLVDRVGVEIYDRGLLFDVIISQGIVYQDHLRPQKVESLLKLDREVIKILTDKFIKQSDYLKCASIKTEYEITLKDLHSKPAEALIDVDGAEERLRKGEMREVSSVYLTLEKVKEFETDSGFAVLRIGNQGILLKRGQKTRISIIPGETGRGTNKFLKEERIHFMFVVGDTAPTPESAKLEDIFHTLLVDRPNNEHVSYYRMVREMGDTATAVSSSVTGVRVNGDAFQDLPDGGLIADLSGHLTSAVKEMTRLFYGAGRMPSLFKER